MESGLLAVTKRKSFTRHTNEYTILTRPATDAKLKYYYLSTTNQIMAKLKWPVAETVLSRTILLCVVFIGLNILDAWLTGVALGLGSQELNPFLGMRFGGSILIKGLISVGIVMVLVLFKRDRLLKPLNVAMVLICAWNALAVLSWS
jgi:hypothetical protein